MVYIYIESMTYTHISMFRLSYHKNICVHTYIWYKHRVCVHVYGQPSIHVENILICVDRPDMTWQFESFVETACVSAVSVCASLVSSQQSEPSVTSLARTAGWAWSGQLPLLIRGAASSGMKLALRCRGDAFEPLASWLQ